MVLINRNGKIQTLEQHRADVNNEYFISKDELERVETDAYIFNFIYEIKELKKEINLLKGI